MNTHLTKLALLTGLAIPSLAIAGPIYSNDFQQASSDPSAVWSSTLRRDLGGPYSTFLGRFGNTTIDFTLHATESNTVGLPSGSGGSGGDDSDRPFNIVRKNIRFDRVPLPEPDSGGGGGNPPGNNLPPANPGHKFDLGGAVNNGNTQPPTDPLFTVGSYALVFDLMIFDSWDSNYDGFGPDSFSVSINGQKYFEEYIDAHNLNNNFKAPELPTQNAYHPNWQDQIYRDVTVIFDVTQATDRFDIAFIASLTQSIQDESWGLDNVRIESMGQLRGASIPVIPAPGALTLFAAGLGLAARRRR